MLHFFSAYHPQTNGQTKCNGQVKLLVTPSDPECNMAKTLNIKKSKRKSLHIIDSKYFSPERRSWEPVEDINTPALIRTFRQQLLDKLKMKGVRGEYCNNSPAHLQRCQAFCAYSLLSSCITLLCLWVMCMHRLPSF